MFRPQHAGQSVVVRRFTAIIVDANVLVRQPFPPSGLPKRSAGSLIANRSNVAAAIVPSMPSSLFGGMLHGMSDGLRREGYSLMVGDSGYSLSDEERLIESFLAQRPSGMSLHNTQHTDRAAALRKLRRCAEPALMVEAAGGLRSGGEALVQLLARQPDIDVVFCSGDVFALGALFECQRRGWRVPGRITIAGFDDSEMAIQVVPALTTLMIPRAEIGQTAARILLDNLGGRAVGPERVDVGFSIVQRDSA